MLVVLAIPLFSITLGQPDNGTNPTSDSNRQAYDLISQGFGVGANWPLTVVVKLPNQSSSANSSLLSTMQSDIAKTAGVASVTPAAVNSAGTTAVFNVDPHHPAAGHADDRPGQHVARRRCCRRSTRPATSPAPRPGASTSPARSPAGPWLILAVVALSFLLLTTAFRSVVIATKAAILNILSIGAAYGVIVAIFEWGWAKSVIGLQSTLPIPAYVPMLAFCIVFGLSMDDEVFLLSRVHEAWLATRDAHRAVAIGIGATARVITTAALIMIVVFTSFVINPIGGEDARPRDGVRGADRRVAGPDVPGALDHVAARVALPGGCPAGWSRSCRNCTWKVARTQRHRPSPRSPARSASPAEPPGARSRRGPGPDDAPEP